MTFPIEDFFAENDSQKALFEAFLKVIEEFGPVTVNVNKTRISIQARVRFAGVPRKSRRPELICGFWLKRRIESPRFTKVELIPPNNWI